MKTYQYPLFGALMLLILGGCSADTFRMFGGTSQSAATIPDDQYQKDVEFEWKVSKGDRVEIIVVNQSSGEGEQQLNQVLNTGGRMQTSLTRDGTDGFLIPNDGTVRLPLIGEVVIEGMTERQASEKIRSAYLHYLKHPFVSVKILNQKLFVLGEVRKPGVVQVTHGTMTMFEALAYSGDLTDEADRTSVKIIRGGLRNPSLREINLADFSSLKLTSLILQPNDIVYIQPRSMKSYNVAFKEQMPFFEMLHAMLNPFVDYANIKNGNIINVTK